jgi:hypothetical protein
LLVEVVFLNYLFLLWFRAARYNRCFSTSSFLLLIVVHFLTLDSILFIEYGRGFVKIIGETFNTSWSIIVDTPFFISWVENERRKSVDIETGSCLIVTIEAGNDEVLLVGILGSEFFPNWDELGAMFAPWGVVLNKNILSRIPHDLIMSASDDNCNRVIF